MMQKKSILSALFFFLAVQLSFGQVVEKPENVIILIGDGMGISQITAGMIANGGDMNIFRLSTISFMKTHSFDQLITDSAAAGTAMACGVKTKNGTIGMDPEGKPVKSIMEIAKEQGMSTGLIATSSITHATPAAFYAHQTQRTLEHRIALDLLESNVDVAIGGGMKFFTKRADERNLVKEFRGKGYKVYDKIDDLKNRNKSKTIALVADEYLPKTSMRGDYLTMAWEKAFRILIRNDKGFFLMIEGSQIDWAGHTNEEKYLLDEMKDFDKVVGKVMDLLENDKKTLILVLADHETGGLSVTGGSLENKDVKLNWASKQHTPQLIPVFAHGPGAELFTGVYDNTQIFTKLNQLIGE